MFGRTVCYVVILNTPLLGSGSVQAGTVAFGASSEFRVQSGQAAELPLTVSSVDLSGFDAIDLAIRGSRIPSNVEFEYAPSFLATLTFGPPPANCDFAPDCDLFLGGARTVQPPWHGPLFVGTVRVDTGGLGIGEQVDLHVLEGFSQIALAGEVETLSGAVSILIVPEPGTGVLILSALLAAGFRLHRQRRRRGLKCRPCFLG